MRILVIMKIFAIMVSSNDLMKIKSKVVNFIIKLKELDGKREVVVDQIFFILKSMNKEN